MDKDARARAFVDAIHDHRAKGYSEATRQQLEDATIAFARGLEAPAAASSSEPAKEAPAS